MNPEDSPQCREIFWPQHREELLALSQQLYPEFTPALTEERLTLAVEAGMRLLGLLEGPRVVAMSGFWVSARVYCGKYLEPDQIVVHRDFRNQGLGTQLLRQLEAIACREGCGFLYLDAQIDNLAAHRFYHREGFHIVGFHFKKPLDPQSPSSC